MNKPKLFFDSEFTGLRQNTTLISLGIVAEDGRAFYAEFTDYDKSQVDDWLETNVIAHLKYPKDAPHNSTAMNGWTFEVVGDKEFVKNELVKWLNLIGSPDQQFQMVSDHSAYDWMLFCDLFGDAFGIPKCIYYIPLDICTMFYDYGIDEDISREKFTKDTQIEGVKHNALYDARVIKACFDKIAKAAIP
jgi:hypothetical protein